MTTIDVPSPLGWCSEDLADGLRVVAETTLMGTALCARHNNERIESVTQSLSDPGAYGY